MHPSHARRHRSISSLHHYARRHTYQPRRSSLAAALAPPHVFGLSARLLSASYPFSTYELVRKYLSRTFKNRFDARPPGDLQHSRDSGHVGSREHKLSEEQMQALRLADEGENLFITGRAGTGKSVMIKRIIAQALERDPKRVIAITAPTGAAAALVGGRTVHSWAGIGAADKCRNFYLERIRCSGNWIDTEMLIIDEISMVHMLLCSSLRLYAPGIGLR